MFYHHCKLYFLIGLFLAISGCATTTTEETSKKEKSVSLLDDVRKEEKAKKENHNVWQRLRDGYNLPKENIPTSGQKRIQQILSRYKNNSDDIIRQTLAAKPYIFYIVDELEKNNLPLELALLPFVESSYDPFAYSRSRASGLWQFIPGTGRRFGLKDNWWQDQRRNITASTQAAIEYLTLLHEHFDGNWLHAIAAYNAGEGTVKRAIRKNRAKGKPTDYWSLSLPKETRFYIPKLLAWSDIILNAKEYNIALPNIENKPYFAIINIGSQIDLATLAELSGMSIKKLYQLNPSYHRWATDPKPPHDLLFPVAIADKVKAALDTYPPEKRIHWQRYRIKQGDSLSQIAQKFGLSISVVKNVNNLRTSRIRAGKTLLIPQASKDLLFYAKRPFEQHKGVKQARKVIYRVRSGDSLYRIASRFKVSINNIKKWNNLQRQRYLQVGQKIALYINR